MLATAKKTDIIEKYRTHESDTGSPEVQIAILRERIGELTDVRRLVVARPIGTSRRTRRIMDPGAAC